MNFVFTDGASSYIGTAGHCVDKGGDVVMQAVGLQRRASELERQRREQLAPARLLR